MIKNNSGLKSAVERILCAVLPLIEATERTPKDIAIEVQGYYREIMRSTAEDKTAEFPIHVTDEGMAILLAGDFDYTEREMISTHDDGVTIVAVDDQWCAFILTWESTDKQFLPDDHDLRLRQLFYWVDYAMED